VCKFNTLGSGIVLSLIDFYISLFKLLVKDNVMLLVDFFSTGLPPKRKLSLILR